MSWHVPFFASFIVIRYKTYLALKCFEGTVKTLSCKAVISFTADSCCINSGKSIWNGRTFTKCANKANNRSSW